MTKRKHSDADAGRAALRNLGEQATQLAELIPAVADVVDAQVGGDRRDHEVARARVPRLVAGVFNDRRHQRRKVAIRFARDASRG